MCLVGGLASTVLKSFPGQVANVCKETGAAEVRVVYADLTDPQETKKLGEVSENTRPTPLHTCIPSRPSYWRDQEQEQQPCTLLCFTVKPSQFLSSPVLCRSKLTTTCCACADHEQIP